MARYETCTAWSGMTRHGMRRRWHGMRRRWHGMAWLSAAWRYQAALVRRQPQRLAVCACMPQPQAHPPAVRQRSAGRPRPDSSGPAPWRQRCVAWGTGPLAPADVGGGACSMFSTRHSAVACRGLTKTAACTCRQRVQACHARNAARQQHHVQRSSAPSSHSCCPHVHA